MQHSVHHPSFNTTAKAHVHTCTAESGKLRTTAQSLLAGCGWSGECKEPISLFFCLLALHLSMTNFFAHKKKDFKFLL